MNGLYWKDEGLDLHSHSSKSSFTAECNEVQGDERTAIGSESLQMAALYFFSIGSIIAYNLVLASAVQ